MPSTLSGVLIDNYRVSTSSEQFMPRLAAGSSTVGVSLRPEQIRQFECFADELRAANERVNLTAITARAAIETKHFLDSLTAIPILLQRAEAKSARIIDVGTGAGLPGLALAIAVPDLEVTLIEATAKKAAFVARTIERLGIGNAHLLSDRAEEVARSAAHRERYDFAIARAVGRMAVLVELLIPFLRVGGWALLMKKLAGLEREVEKAAPAVERLSATVDTIADVSIPPFLEDRAIVVLRKYAATADRYPRRAGVPARRPLH